MVRIDEPTSKDLIVALNDMYNSWATICSGILSLQKDFDAVGIDDWFNDALNTQYVDGWSKDKDLLGERYDNVFVTREFDKLKMPEFCEDMITYIRTHAKSLQGDTSVGNAYTFKHISNPNKAQVIDAFNVLYDAMYTFASGVGGYYGVSDSVKEDLGEDWIDDALAEYDSVQDGPYFGTFSSSYDEGVMSMMEVCDGFEEYLKKGGKIEFSHSFESKLKIKVHERSRSEDCGSSASSLGATPTGGRRKMDDESVRRTRHYGR